MAPKLEVPKFTTDAEESEWWYAHRDTVNEQINDALLEGHYRPGVTDRRGNTPTTTIRLDPADITKARAAAEKRGLKYQTYLKMLIHEALEKESAA
jgi:predicted DNA binding CopG/RHH family protein